MTPAEAASVQREETQRLALAVQEPFDQLEHAATEVARMVRQDAQRNGRSVGIRVVRKASGVRVTVTGPSAARYRRVVQDELERRIPEIGAEVRARITRKP